MLIVFFKFGLLLNFVVAVPPSGNSSENLQDDLNSLKFAAKMLAIHLEKWNNIYLTSVEPRMTSSASLLASIDSNINNLQERAHVWDTFQLHVSAWNDQLATLDRKIDIISKGQEKMISLDAKINAMVSIEYKIDKAVKKLEDIEETISNLNVKRGEEKVNYNYHREHDALFGEFAARGILSTVKTVEKKLDRLLLNQQDGVIKPKSNNDEVRQNKLTFKCNIPKVVEELLNDVSSKVDLMYDQITDGKEENEEYEGSGEEIPVNTKLDYNNERFFKKVVKRINRPCRHINQIIEDVYYRTLRIENASRIIVDKENINLENYDKLFQHCGDQNILSKIDEKSDDFNENVNKILESYFSEQRAHFESFLLKQTAIVKNINNNNNICSIISSTSNTAKVNRVPNELEQEEDIIYESSQLGCEDLERDQKNGIYIFSDYNTKYCLVRDDGLWTVIQRRDNYVALQNFSLGWQDYKTGFGNLSKDFWFGNDVISEMTGEKDVVLRIELSDFDDNFAWAEYSTFKVLSEDDNYTLIVDGYSGNASDSFLSHNGSMFSTVDRKNDEAPECCPCSESYGGGWWFDSCFESNLNGIYHRKEESNGYFRGIIWEHWLGNYSLKRSVMMVKPKGKIISVVPPTTSSYYYEDP